MDQRVSLVTLGVADIAAARAFYERLGWRASSASSADVVFFQAGGSIVGLYPFDALAEDARGEPARAGSAAVTLALNLASPEAVDATLAEAEAAGATIAKPAEKAFWGGYSGYFRDPDGHYWEVAHNPFWPLDADGAPRLPA